MYNFLLFSVTQLSKSIRLEILYIWAVAIKFQVRLGLLILFKISKLDSNLDHLDGYLIYSFTLSYPLIIDDIDNDLLLFWILFLVFKTPDLYKNPIILGSSNTGTGVRGISVSHYGVYGSSNNNHGVWGNSLHGWGGYFTSGDGHPLYVGNNSVEFFRVASTGFVGLNQTSPVARLHVNGDIMAAGDVTAFGSDERLKKEISVISDALEKIKEVILEEVIEKIEKLDVHTYKHPDGFGMIGRTLELIEKEKLLSNLKS